MRTISEIKEDIKTKEYEIEDLKKEFREFQDNCPHPPVFVKYETHDSEDDCLGPGIYEYTLITYKCSMCEAVFSGTYDKNTESRPQLKDFV